MRKRKLILLAVIVLAFGGTAAWQVLHLPPPQWILRYGVDYHGGPTGRTLVAEGVEFVEIGPGCFRMGSEFLAKKGDWLV